MAALALATGLNVLPSTLQARVIHRLSRGVGTMWWKTNRGTVRRVRHHLQVLFGYEEGDAELESLIRDQLVLTTLNALIINLLPSLHDEHLDRLLQVEGLHHLGELGKRGQPVLLLGAHYGAYGYAVAAALSAKGYPTWLVGYGGTHGPPPQTSRLYNTLYWPRVRRLNQRISIATVEPGEESQPELVRVLERSTDIFYLLPDQYFTIPHDQDLPAHLAPLQLLNHTVYLDTSAVRLAKQVGAQPFTAIPVKDGRRQCVLIEPITWAGDGTAAEDVAQDLQIYLARLEEHLLGYPALWRDLRRPDLLSRMGLQA
jgi:lauroyl/myristoyl acyltransferase